MWEDRYAKEPFDLRLFVLRIFKNAGWICGLTLAGVLIFGGGYYVKKVLLAPEDQYRAVSLYYVTYEKDPNTGNEYTHINAYTWDVLIKTDEFLETIQSHLEADFDKEVLKSYLSADIPSNLNMPSSAVTTNDPDLSVTIAAAAEKSFIDFAGRQKEIESIRVLDPAYAAEKVFVDVRPLRAFLLSGILSLFFIIVLFAIKEVYSDKIWLPATLSRRYGLKVLGTMESKELAVNISYIFKDCKTAAVTAVSAEVDIAAVIGALRESCSREKEEKRWEAVPSVWAEPENCEALRKADGILLTVRAGRDGAKQVEYVLDFLKQQDLTVTAVLLGNADEKLLRRYQG